MHGHADVGISVVIALPKCVEIISEFGLWSPDAVLAYNDEDMDAKKGEEYVDMPDFLRGICEVEDEVAKEPRLSARNRRASDTWFQ